MKLWVIQSFLTFDSKDKTVTIRWKADEQYNTVVFKVFLQGVILETLTILDSTLSGEKGLCKQFL